MNDAQGDPRNYDPNDQYWDPYDYDSNWGGQQDAQTPSPYVAPNPTMPPPATTSTTGGGPTGKTPQQIEAEGRAYDQQRGFIGGYMNGGLWVNGSPMGGGYTPDGGGGGGLIGGDYGSFDPSGFQWPTFHAPTYTPGPAFSYAEKFSAPSKDAIFDDPSYKMRRDEGLQAIEHGAAAKGLTRLPATLKALAGWNQDFASREYGNIFDRSAQTYATNYGVARDTWDRGENQNLNSFDRNYTGSKDMFDFNEWKPAQETFTDIYRRWRDELDATTRLATADPG